MKKMVILNADIFLDGAVKNKKDFLEKLKKMADSLKQKNITLCILVREEETLTNKATETTTTKIPEKAKTGKKTSEIMQIIKENSINFITEVFSYEAGETGKNNTILNLNDIRDKKRLNKEDILYVHSSPIVINAVKQTGFSGFELPYHTKDRFDVIPLPNIDFFGAIIALAKGTEQSTVSKLQEYIFDVIKP